MANSVVLSVPSYALDYKQHETRKQRNAEFNTRELLKQSSVCIDVTTEDAGLSPAITTEEDLHSYTITADNLVIPGQRLDARFSGILGANGSTKTVRLKFASTTLITLATTGSGLSWIIDVSIFCLTSASQKIVAKGTLDAVVSEVSVQATTEDLVSASILKITGQTSVAAADDVLVKVAEAYWQYKPGVDG